MHGLLDRLIVFRDIHGDRGQPGDGETEQDAPPVEEQCEDHQAMR